MGYLFEGFLPQLFVTSVLFRVGDALAIFRSHRLSDVLSVRKSTQLERSETLTSKLVWLLTNQVFPGSTAI